MDYLDQHFLESSAYAVEEEYVVTNQLDGLDHYFTDRGDERIEVRAKKPTFRDWLLGREPGFTVTVKSLEECAFEGMDREERLETRAWVTLPGQGFSVPPTGMPIDAMAILKDREGGPSSPWLQEALANLPEQQTITLKLPRDTHMTEREQKKLERLLTSIVKGGYMPKAKKPRQPVAE